MDEKWIHQYSLRVHQAAALYTAAWALPTVLHLPRRIDKRPDRIRLHASYLRLCLHFPCSPPQPQAAPPPAMPASSGAAARARTLRRVGRAGDAGLRVYMKSPLKAVSAVVGGGPLLRA